MLFNDGSKQLEEMRKCDQIELFRRGAEQAELVTQSDFAVGFRMMMNQIIKTERQIGAVWAYCYAG